MFENKGVSVMQGMPKCSDLEKEIDNLENEIKHIQNELFTSRGVSIGNAENSEIMGKINSLRTEIKFKNSERAHCRP
jgi:TnpA family transposase